ncbi:hypothetical protein [Nostoc sp. KVJ20]|uniref:hypothetical protein n=1 Tax=Nostoc sp. KVJ20 TaxID=457944 RepID=UPI000A8BC0E1|nr:hypothetical protein [Nostoc sp. KVJ20]
MLKAVNFITHLHNSNILRISGNRKVETVALKEVQPLTGYIRGCVTALASKKD